MALPDEDFEGGEDPAVRRLRERISGIDEDADSIDAQEEEPGPSDDDLVDLSGDEPGEPGSRAEKKRARGELFESNRRLEQENAELNARLARLEGYAAAHQQQQQQYQQAEDPIDAALKSVNESRRQLFSEYEARLKANNGAMSDEERAQFDARNNEIDEERIRLSVQKYSPQPNQRETAVQAIRAQVNATYPDVVSNPQASAWAQFRMKQRIAEGRPDDWDTLDLVMSEARQQFGMRKSSGPPSDARKSKFTGASRGGGGGSGGKQYYRMSDVDKRLASAMYPHIKDAKERNKLWVKSVKGRKAGS